MGFTTKRTHEEFISLLNEKFPNITTDDIYINAKTKMKFMCKIDNYEWSTNTDSLLHSRGCPKCNGKYHKTNEEFINTVKLNNKNYNNIEILSEYKTLKGKIHCKCKIDNYEWYPTARMLMNGGGCPKCGGTLKLTHEEYIERLNNLGVLQKIEILSRYCVQKEKIKCRCKLDGHEWYAFPQNLLRGHGCPKCSAKEASIRITKTHEKFVEEMKVIHPNYEILGVYTSNNCDITYMCKICGHIKTTTPAQLLRGDECKGCLSVSKRLPHEVFVKQLSERNPNIELISEYTGKNNKVKVKCKTHGCEWYVLPSNAFKTVGCHVCNDTIGEKKISDILDSMGINYFTQHRFDDCRNIRPLPFDFYLPDKNICIEYDGEQHYRPVNFGGCSDDVAIESYKNTVFRDHIKNKYCDDNDIKLIRIKYSEFNEIESIIKNVMC